MLSRAPRGNRQTKSCLDPSRGRCAKANAQVLAEDHCQMLKLVTEWLKAELSTSSELGSFSPRAASVRDSLRPCPLTSFAVAIPCVATLATHTCTPPTSTSSWCFLRVSRRHPLLRLCLPCPPANLDLDRLLRVRRRRRCSKY